MENLRSKSVLVADNGLFAELAPRLARDFGEVKYFMPWTSAYPKAAAAHVGLGLEGVERVATFWDHVPDADLVVFPDIYFSDAQDVVINRFHKPVWGHRAAEALELDRRGTRKLQIELNLPAHPTRFITGVKSLSEYLKRVENKWVKISAYRGDGETWHHDTWHTSRIYLDNFKHRVGALAESYEFLVEENIDGIEIGYDGWTVHGGFPDASYWGFEIKDQAYIGKFSPYPELPSVVRIFNEKFASILRDERAVGFCSFEFRLPEGGPAYLIDPCMRAGSPPFEATIEAYDNLGEIMWQGANGIMAAPKSLGEYTAIAIIHSQFALENWVPLECPPDVRRWVKLHNAAVIDGELYHVPTGGGLLEIGAVCAVADTLEEAISLVKERAEKVKGFSLEIRTDALDSAQEEIDKAKSFGIDF